MGLDFNTIQKIYFIGIGGIGMSAIARYMNHKGIHVYGYDKTETVLTKKLVEEGMEIHYTDDPSRIPADIDLVVYTPAIPDDHAELTYLRSQGYPIVKRAEALGIISGAGKAIAIAGTHGKTSTSAITTHVLKAGGEDISAFVGGIMSTYKGNFITGDSPYIVTEADEYDRSFLHLHPYIASVMSMDADHLDIYGDAHHLIESFNSFIQQIVDGGYLLIRKDLTQHLSDKTHRILAERQINMITILGESADVDVDNVHVEDGCFVYDYHWGESSIAGLKLPMPGLHNVHNATVSVTIAMIVGIEAERITKGLESFGGVKRRFERIYSDTEVDYIDDYAHHPSELKVAIEAARTLFPGRKVLGVFQPHLFSRTRDFLQGFAEELDKLDEVILLDIYPARELPIEGVTSERIAERMEKDVVVSSKERLIEELKRKEIDVIITLGAGDIDTLVPHIRSYLTNDRKEK